MIEAIDSHYQSVKQRVLALNSARQFGGIMEARDWPTQPQLFDAFYLLTLGFTPLGKQAYSATSLIVSHLLQWVWIGKGTDIQSGIVGANRGDRYRTSLRMQTELLNGLYPYFTQKQTWAADQNTGKVTGTPVQPPESILWTPPVFHSRTDKASGLIYGAASVNLTSMTDSIAA